MIRIFIADDHAIIRDGLKRIFSGVAEFQIVGEAGNGDELVSLLKKTDADVLTLDMSMPGKNGLPLIRHIKAMENSPAILVLTMHQEPQFATHTIKAGASGFIPKCAPSCQVIEGVRKMAQGGTFFSSEVAEQIIRQLTHPASQLPHTKLSGREFETFKMLIKGKSINEIARLLCLSSKTISTHKANILQKMEMNTSTSLVYYALKHGLVEADYDFQ